MNDDQLARYYEAKRLREVEHWTFVRIGEELGISERSVRRILRKTNPSSPESKDQKEKKMMLDRETDQIQKVVKEYGENPVKVFEKLKSYQVKTSLRSVQRWLKTHRGETSPCIQFIALRARRISPN